MKCNAGMFFFPLDKQSVGGIKVGHVLVNYPLASHIIVQEGVKG